jgi:ABC-type transport system involved in multi-copper enzyme maturation permease subunit
MLLRIGTIAFNTYRESVRARVLYGLMALALGTSLYSIAVGAFALKNAARVVSDLGGASISLYAILVSVVISGTSLYREVEQKTIFPVLTRPISRGEYLVGKYFGTLLTLLVFIAFDAGACLLIVAAMAGRSIVIVSLVAVAAIVTLAVGAWKLSLGVAVIGAILASSAPDEQRVVVGMSLLALFEVGIVAAFATLFASFSSPFLSVVFTLGIWLVGRSADTLAKMPEKTFGPTIQRVSAVLSHVVPNLQVYVPARPLLTGEATSSTFGMHLLLALAQTAAWAVGLLAVSSVIFRRRDFL